MTDMAERLSEAMRMRKTDQTGLARALGVTQGAISKIVLGKTQNSRLMPRIAAHLRVPLAWLLAMSDELGDDASSDNLDVVMVRELDLVLGLGGTFLDGPVVERMKPFPRDWIQQFTDTTDELLAFVRCKGDSMVPTILDGDICLLDLSRRRLDEQDALWAVSFGELGMVKRLRQMPDGTVKIMSDNQSVREERATDGELYLMGRVAAVISRK